MKKGPATTTTTSKTNLPPAQGKTFNPAHYVRPGLSEADVLEIKAGFDLFDTDQGGSIDTNCTYLLTQNSRPQWSLLDLTPRTQSFSK